MPRFRLNTTDDSPPTEVEASSWISALSQVFQRVGLGASKNAKVVCDLGVEGDMRLSVADSDLEVTMSEISEDAEGTSDWSLGDDPTNEMWNPPDPSRVPAFADREALGEADLERIMAQGRGIADCLSHAAAQELALDILMSFIPAESASVLLLDGVLLRFVAVRGPKSASLQDVEMPSNEGIAGLVVSSGSALLVREVDKHGGHFEEVDEWVKYKTRHLLAVPVTDGARIYGVIELLNPFGRIDFASWHQDAAIEIGRLLGGRLQDA